MIDVRPAAYRGLPDRHRRGGLFIEVTVTAGTSVNHPLLLVRMNKQATGDPQFSRSTEEKADGRTKQKEIG